MNSGFRLSLPAFALATMLLSGCLPKPATVSTRHFVLAPILTNAPAAAAAEHLSVGIGFVTMPPYLLRDPIALRKSSTEIEYLDDALWGERLDQSFRRAVAADLSGLLSSDSIHLMNWASERVAMTVSITVEQFDVDTHGRGTLRAQWRITPSASGLPSRDGNVQLVRTASPPRGNPEVIAATLSQLTSEFSRELAQAICGLAMTNRSANDQ